MNGRIRWHSKRFTYCWLTDNKDGWLLNSRIYQWAQEKNLAVVMPNGENMFYLDNDTLMDRHGEFVGCELVQASRKLFRLSNKREDTFIAGLSMGGYGAIKCGLTRPDFYGACASFSGALDPQARIPHLSEVGMERQIVAILGDNLVFPDDASLFKLAEKTDKLSQKPRVLVTCGDEDYLLDHSRRFDEHMKKLSIPYKYMEWAGDHDFKFWEESLPVMFKYFEEEAL